MHDGSLQARIQMVGERLQRSELSDFVFWVPVELKMHPYLLKRCEQNPIKHMMQPTVIWIIVNSIYIGISQCPESFFVKLGAVSVSISCASYSPTHIYHTTGWPSHSKFTPDTALSHPWLLGFKTSQSISFSDVSQKGYFYCTQLLYFNYFMYVI